MTKLEFELSSDANSVMSTSLKLKKNYVFVYKMCVCVCMYTLVCVCMHRCVYYINATEHMWKS